MKIIWIITGAGHLLRESIKLLDEISENHIISIVLSNAAEEVIRLYGLKSRLEKIKNKNIENNMITEKKQQYSYPFSGKITKNKYDLVVLSPATANTVAKIVHGIADNLVTNVIAQSGKGQIPAFVLPVDQKEGLITTIIPPYINKELCKQHSSCVVEQICPKSAIKIPKIDSTICTGCMKCSDICPYNAVITKEKIELYIRKIDAENTRKLEKIENITTIYTIKELKEKIEDNN